MAASVSVRSRVFAREAIAQANASSVEQRAQIAHRAASDARTEAPVLTGAYRDGVTVLVDGADVTISDTDETAIHKEYGTSDTPAHATLINAASRYGTYYGARPRGSR
ncbi:HK97 gp10 family phage protein [Gordonia sp. (in: high G+C Gram-positive bacteria)]|uniref:HK97 gp10 family phage protein n=1 Tax=Gordonia sp. (in: high G+C Gram-positive bacteria) TaxID=84139 RepID=UPI003C76CF4B